MFGVKTLRLLAKIAAFCLVSSLTVGLTVDLVFAEQGVSGALLPELLHSKSLPSLSLNQLTDGEEYEALSTARSAVLRQPLSVEALTGLARSSANLKPQMSMASLAQAASLGWRDALVQAMVINAAASTNSWKVVAFRVLALTKLDRLDLVNQANFADENAPMYTQPMVEAFTNDGVAWFRFVGWLRTMGREVESEHLLAETPFFNRIEECIHLGYIAQDFVREGKIDFAAELVDNRCQKFLTSSKDRHMITPNFGDYQRGPFEWQIVTKSGIDFRVFPNDGANALEVFNRDPVPRVIARKIMRRSEYEAAGKLHLVQFGGGDLIEKFVPISVECANRESDYRGDEVASTLIARRHCPFVRVKFQIPSGRFRLMQERF